jgi:hypothetical protein
MRRLRPLETRSFGHAVLRQGRRGDPAPLIVEKASHQAGEQAGVSAHLAEELPAPWLRWGYAAVLVLSVEVMAGGCLIAAGARQAQPQPEALSGSSGILGLGLAEALRVAPRPSPGAGQGLEEGLGLSETHGCPWCERTFSSAAARDGHKRHCPGRQVPQANEPGPLASAAEVRT